MIRFIMNSVLFFVFLGGLLAGLSLAQYVLGDVIGLVTWIIFVGFVLASLFDDGEEYHL